MLGMGNEKTKGTALLQRAQLPAATPQHDDPNLVSHSQQFINLKILKGRSQDLWLK